MNGFHLRCFTVFTAVVFFIIGRSQAVVLDGPSAGSTPSVFSAAMVDGWPAAAWTNYPFTTVKYARALDADGKAWGPPVILYTGDAGAPLEHSPGISLLMVDGRPAVCYARPGSPELTFVRAADAAGVQWEAPVKINAGVSRFAMAVVDGMPAIAYSTPASSGLRYVRATAADGSAWGSPVTIASGFGGAVGRVYLLFSGGNPVVVSADSNSMWKMQAQDPAGNSWSRIPEPDFLTNYRTLIYCACEVPNGLAMAYKVKEAIAPLTYYWFTGAGETALLDFTFYDCYLAMVGDKLAMTYASGGLHFMMSDDSQGHQWKTPAKVLSQNTGSHALLDVNGTAAILYLDGNRLHYLRLLPGGGVPPEIRIEKPGTTPGGIVVLNGGTTVDFGKTPIGAGTLTPFAVRNLNAGSADLTVESITIDGPDAADFTVSESPVGINVPGDATIPFTLQFAPRTLGYKTAVMHMVSNSSMGTYTLFLKGESTPLEIDVHLTTVGASLDAARPLYLPPLAAGTSRDYSLTIGNPGSVELNGLMVTIDGPDGAEFSVVSPPAATVAPRSSTTFLLRHASAAAGPRTAMLHIASPDIGFPAPYDVPVQVLAPGKVDRMFHWFTGNDPIYDAALRADGSILVGSNAGLHSLRPDGRPDPSFFRPAIDSLVQATGSVESIAVLYDGKILIGGFFDEVNGSPRKGLARLHPDGALDESFTPGIPVRTRNITVQPDGKILVVNIDGSDFAVRRLLPDGAVDDTVNVQGVNGVRCLTLREDGDIFVGGDFRAINDLPLRLMRIDPGGTPHAFGNIPERTVAGAYAAVSCLAMQPDGGMIAGGDFPNGALRLKPDGQPDSFPSFSWIYSLALQADGACLVGAAGSGLRRVSPAGQLDTFRTTNAPGLFTYADQTLIETDGSILITGIVNLEGIPNTNIPGSTNPNARLARVYNDPATSVLQLANGGTTLRWLRGGTAPEVSDVIFQSRSTGATDWTLLGNGTRIPGGWELSGLTFSSSGTVRALGRQGGSVMAALLSILSPLESWRLQYFHTSDNTGNAADDADPDHDGLTNFTEYAFGLSPVDRTSNAVGSSRVDLQACKLEYSIVSPK